MAFRAAFGTTSHRVHVMERAWERRMHECTLYRYTFDPTPFAAHGSAAIDLRMVDDLHPYRDTAMQGPWDLSIIRLHPQSARSDPSHHLPSE